MRHRILVLTIVVAALLAPSAEGAVLFGDDINVGTPDVSLGDNVTGANEVPTPASALSLRAPADGVVTRIRLRYGTTNAEPGYVSFRLMRGDAPKLTARHATPSGNRVEHPLPASSTGGILVYTPNDANDRRVGIKIAAGDRLGLYQLTPGTAAIGAATPGAKIAFRPGDHASGEMNYNGPVEARIFLDALMEPDADADGYGDETQDNCPSIANDQTANPCPKQKEVVVQRETAPAPPPVVVPGPRVVIPGPFCTVPSLRGLSASAARTRLTRAGCVRGTLRGSRSSRARVRAQTIPAGTRVAQGTRVGLTLRAPVKRRAG